MPTDKEMSRGDISFQYSDEVLVCKWFDNRGVNLCGANIEGQDITSNVLRRQKGSANKLVVPCPGIVKRYNHGMGGVDLLDQRVAAYRYNRKSKVRYYLRMFFDLQDIALVNSYVLYNILYPGKLSLLEYKIVIAHSLIGKFCSRERNHPSTKHSNRVSVQVMPTEVPLHLPVFGARQRCYYCAAQDKESRTYASCDTCGVALCVLKERNCFYKHHYRR